MELQKGDRRKNGGTQQCILWPERAFAVSPLFFRSELATRGSARVVNRVSKAALAPVMSCDRLSGKRAGWLIVALCERLALSFFASRCDLCLSPTETRGSEQRSSFGRSGGKVSSVSAVSAIPSDFPGELGVTLVELDFEGKSRTIGLKPLVDFCSCIPQLDQARRASECACWVAGASTENARTECCWCVCRRIIGEDSNLVDSASSHTLVSKIKPCMSKYKSLTLKLRTAHYISYSLFDSPLLLG